MYSSTRMTSITPDRLHTSATLRSRPMVSSLEPGPKDPGTQPSSDDVDHPRTAAFFRNAAEPAQLPAHHREPLVHLPRAPAEAERHKKRARETRKRPERAHV